MSALETVVKGVAALFVAFVIFAAFLGVIGLIFAFPVMLLWNWLLPVIFGVTTITYWQAFGLFFLCGLLFKGVNTSSSK